MYELLAKITAHPKRLNRVAWTINLVPMPLLWLMSWFVAGGAWCLPNIRRHWHRNLQSVFEESRWWWRSWLTLANLHYLVLTLLEVLKTADPKKLPACTLKNHELIEQALQRKRGVILVAPHTGNFFYAYWYLCQHYNCLTVGTAGSAELRPLYQRFVDLGCRGLDYDATPPLTLVRTLRQHLAENGVVFLLGDFWRKEFPLTTLMGRMTRAPQGAALFGLEHDVPIIPCAITRQGWQHRITCQEILELGNDYTRQQRDLANDELLDQLSMLIERRPEQWLYWFNCHERWEDNQDLGWSLEQIPTYG